MRNVSNEFIELSKERGDFYPYAQVTFADGRTLNLGKSDFSITGSSIIDSASTSSFALGVSIAKQIELSIFNDKDQFSNYDFYGATILLYLRFDLSAATESIKIGTFTVTTPENYGTIITVDAVDDMYKLDKSYSTTLSFPATLSAIVRDSCSTCSVTLGSTTFTNDSFTVQEMPTDITHRNLIAYAAQIAGGNARFDENNALQITSYDLSSFESSSDLDGGIFDTDTPYSSGDSADGGSFNPWDTGDVADGGTFGDRANIHVLNRFVNLTVETDDVVITGIQTTADDTTYLSGSEGYVLTIDNPLITGSEQAAVDLIGSLIVGLKFRPFSGDYIAYPLAEFGDLAYVVDRKGNAYQTVFTDVDFTFFGYTTLKCSADSPIRNSSQYYSEATKAVIEARKNTAKDLSTYDLAVQQLTDLLAQSFGTFKTEEVLDDDSTIFYLHDKPTLAESTTIWRMTADAFAVSTDGGVTWNAGIDSSGNAVVNVLSAVGINADWINAGTITGRKINNGSGTFAVDESGNVTANSFNSSNATITGGSFNVTTSAQASSAINLGYSGWSAQLAPLQLKLSASSAGNDFLVQAGGLYFYSNGTVTGGMNQNVIYYGSSAYSGYGLSIMGSGAIQSDFNVYGTFYAASGTIGSSDRKIKKNIKNLDAEFCKSFILSLEPCKFRYKDGTSGRYHHGFIADKVKTAMGGEDWGLYCEVTRPARTETVTNEKTGKTKEVVREKEKTIAGLRYEELIAPMVKVIQSQQEEIDELKATLAKVMAFINYEGE